MKRQSSKIWSNFMCTLDLFSHAGSHFRLVSQFSLGLSLGQLFVASHISLKRWLSDKGKENCDTNLKLHSHDLSDKCYLLSSNLWQNNCDIMHGYCPSNGVA